MFQRAFHRFHNCVDCSIFGVKKPVVIRAINSKVTHGGESTDGKWEYKNYRSSKSSDSSSSTSYTNRCAITYLIKQLSLFAPFPKCPLDADENGNTEISNNNHANGLVFLPPTLSSKSLTPLELKLYEATIIAKRFQHSMRLLGYDSLVRSSMKQIPSHKQPLSSLLYEDSLQFDAFETTENPELPQLNSVSTSTSTPQIQTETLSQSTQTDSTASLTFDSIPEKVIVDLPVGQYKGEVLNGVQHGHGVFVYSNGDTYSGEWDNGLAHGNGRMIYSNCGMYDGEWKAGQRHGIGLYIPLEDNVYVGEWRNNNRHGYGRQFSSSGKLLYDGQWAENERNGTGTAYFGKDEVYMGEWQDGKMHGHGIFSRGEDMLQWEGEWDDGVNKHGVWHINTDLTSNLSSSGENATNPSIYDQYDMKTRALHATSPSLQNSKSTRAKVIVVHGVQPQDQIVVQYGI